tara:strand:+ start:17332 stop:17823 length:492 start_codon:yes stop_codon:yes gene_type:complete
MIQAKHCDLCKYPKRNLKNGLTCGLSNKTPIFENTCSDIKFSNVFKKHLPELLSQIELEKNKATSIYLSFTLFGVVGLIIIILTSLSRFEKTLEFDFSYSSFNYLCGTLLLYIVGITLISKAYMDIKTHRNLLRNLVTEKKEINRILNKYSLTINALLNIKRN